jgi:hypothetical protein
MDNRMGRHSRGILVAQTAADMAGRQSHASRHYAFHILRCSASDVCSRIVVRPKSDTCQGTMGG